MTLREFSASLSSCGHNRHCGQIIRKLRKATWEQGLGRLPEARLNAEVNRVLADLSATLGAGRFFWSDSIGAADLAVHGQLGFGLSGTTPTFAEHFGQYKNLVAFYDRVSEDLAAKASV